MRRGILSLIVVGALIASSTALATNVTVPTGPYSGTSGGSSVSFRVVNGRTIRNLTYTVSSICVNFQNHNSYSSEQIGGGSGFPSNVHIGSSGFTAVSFTDTGAVNVSINFDFSSTPGASNIVITVQKKNANLGECTGAATIHATHQTNSQPPAHLLPLQHTALVFIKTFLLTLHCSTGTGSCHGILSMKTSALNRSTSNGVLCAEAPYSIASNHSKSVPFTLRNACLRRLESTNSTASLRVTVTSSADKAFVSQLVLLKRTRLSGCGKHICFI